jgi:hypothetical protein
MTAPYNPYEAPAGGYDIPAAPPIAGAMITPLMVEHLRGARGWIRLLSVFGFIGGGFMLLGAGAAILFGILGIALAPSTSSGAELTPLVGLVYIPFSAFYLVPAFLLHRIANSIDGLQVSVTSPAVEDILDKNRAFWKTMGIMTLVVIGLTVLLTVGAFLFGIAAALMKLGP